MENGKMTRLTGLELRKQLKPCPFCGCEDMAFVTLNRFMKYIECENCHAKSGIAVRKNDAVKKWNRRAEDGKVD